ncbi:MAG: MBL fold metallo-hydrolase [Bacteroidota bacterium]
MKVTFLGTGTSQGVPVIACDCSVCQSTDSKDKRLRCSVLIETERNTFVIDTGPDFRYQMLRESVKDVDAFLFTHEHKDHIAGLDDVRAFNFRNKKDAQVYGNANVLKAIKNDFHYAFDTVSYPGVPRIKLNHINNSPFEINGDRIIPILVWHYKLPVLGFRIGDFTYITDAKTIEEDEIEKIKGSRVLVLNALRKEDHISHFTLSEAIQISKEIGAEQTLFTHISHLMGKHDEVQAELPENTALAYDGLSFFV